MVKHSTSLGLKGGLPSSQCDGTYLTLEEFMEWNSTPMTIAPTELSPRVEFE